MSTDTHHIVESADGSITVVFRGSFDECLSELHRLKHTDPGTRTVSWWIEPSDTNPPGSWDGNQAQELDKKKFERYWQDKLDKNYSLLYDFIKGRRKQP